MNNTMPKWWKMEMWQKQYPQKIDSLCDFNIESLKKTQPPDLSMRYCPPYTAPSKAGRPKEGKRKKGCLEEKKPKKRMHSANETVNDWQAKTKGPKKRRFA